MTAHMKSRARLDVAVAGGGVVGAACALALARAGLQAALVEAHDIRVGLQHGDETRDEAPAQSRRVEWPDRNPLGLRVGQARPLGHGRRQEHQESAAANRSRGGAEPIGVESAMHVENQ